MDNLVKTNGAVISLSTLMFQKKEKKIHIPKDNAITGNFEALR